MLRFRKRVRVAEPQCGLDDHVEMTVPCSVERRKNCSLNEYFVLNTLSLICKVRHLARKGQKLASYW